MNSLKKHFLVGLLICLFCVSCTKKNENLLKSISYIEDSNFVNTTIQEQNFKPLNNPRLGPKNGWYWFKVLTKSDSIPLIFTVEGNSIDRIEVYHQNQKISDLKNNVDPTNVALKVFPSNDNCYFFKVHFAKQVNFPLKVHAEDAYFFHKRSYFLINGVYYGVVIMMIIVNLFFYFSIKEKTFLAYCFFVAFTNIGLTDYDGFINIWFDKATIKYISIFMHFLVPLSSGVFASLLLDHYKLVVSSVRISVVTILIAIGFYVLFVVTDEFLYFALGDTVGLLFFTYYMYLGVLHIKNEVYAKLSVIGYSLIFFSAVTFVLPLNWGIQAYMTPLFMIKIGAVFEMLILSYAITYRVKKIQEENEIIQNEIQQYVTKIYVLEKELTIEKKKPKKNFVLEQKIDELAAAHELTHREKEVLLQISKGMNNQKIADELFVSVNTIKYHIRNIYQKLDVKRRTEITSKIMI